MHDTALKHGGRFFETYLAGRTDAVVVDLGALDVNGSLRDVCPAVGKYIGVDFAKGRGVDVILDDPYHYPFADNSVDCVVSSSCFEHAELFWVSFLEALRILKPAGLFYLNAPSNGEFHRYPRDCWRFYPDSGRALALWARRNGHNTILLESFVGHQDRGPWNDFVAVFLKDEAAAGLYPNRIVSQYRDFDNGLVHGSDEILNHKRLPEDQRTWRRRLISGLLGHQI